MSNAAEFVVIVGIVFVVGALYHISRALDRIAILLLDRLPPDPDDDQDDDCP